MGCEFPYLHPVLLDSTDSLSRSKIWYAAFSCAARPCKRIEYARPRAVAGVDIPSVGEMSVRNMRFEVVPDDTADEDMRTYANREETLACSAQQVVADARPQIVPSAVPWARSTC
jgi:hypothetical protein